MTNFAKRTQWNLALNRLSEALAQHRAEGKPLLDLTASNPTECGFVYDQKAILDALRDPRALHYEPAPRGLVSAREAVAGYYAGHGAAVAIDDIVLTTSTSEAYSFVFRLLCNPGDEILIPAPSYPLFDFLADIQDVKLARYPLVYDHGWQIDFHALEQAITPRTRAIIVVHPNNPTGHFTKPTEMEKLNAICAARDLTLIADEVFLDFSLKSSEGNVSEGHSERREESAIRRSGAGDFSPPLATRHSPLATPISFAGNREVLTFTMSGISKICGLPQMKAAWLVVSGPERAKKEALARLEMIADTYLSMNAPVQLAIPAFLSQRGAFQEQLMARVRQNLAELDRQLALQKLCTRLEIEGGWYAVLRVPATSSDEDLALSLLNNSGVYVHPGHFYDFSMEGYLVLSMISPRREFSKALTDLLLHFH
jgi:alanine-synthesizing transaminase